MKVFITKHALTTGIEEKEAEICKHVSSDMISIVGSRFHETYFGKGRDWHETRESAVARAEQMRVAKIKSLEKSINKLRKLSFA